jgi:hypothetical protein
MKIRHIMKNINLNIPTQIQDDLITYLEIARMALADGDFFDQTAIDLDLSDSEMIRLRDNLDYLTAE